MKKRFGTVSRRLKQTFLSTRKRRIITGSIGTLSVASIGLLAFLYSTTQRPVHIWLAKESSTHAVNSPVTVAFSQSLSSDVQLAISPQITGTWKLKRSFLGVRSAEFVPAKKQTFQAATEYKITLEKAKRLISGKTISQQNSHFTTEFAPGVASVSPKPQQTNLLPNQSITITFTEPRTAITQPHLTITPAVELTQHVSSDKKRYSWKPKTALAQSTNYEVTVSEGKPEGKKLVAIPFETVHQPNIVQATEKTYFYPEDKITVDYDTPMETNQVAVVCECEGSGQWESPTHYSFQPTNIAPAKSYKYTIPKGLRSKLGGLREAEVPHVITTPGPVVASVSSVAQSQLTTKLNVTFDQAVKRETVQPKLSANAPIDVKLSWVDDKHAMLSLSKLDYQTTYQVAVAPGVVPQKLGLPSAVTSSGSATTVPQTIKLPVPVYRQAYSLSCEESSLRMALAYRGIQASDMDILQRVGYNPRPIDSASNSWDDPNTMFVGDVNGVQSRKTGYGVYSPPIAAAARSLGRNATAHTGVSASFLATAIHQGNPVVIWGSSSRGARFDWNVPGGTASGWVGQHARTLVGVVGRADAPLGFYVNDPLNGSQRYWSVGELMANMDSYGNLSNQAVVVY